MSCFFGGSHGGVGGDSGGLVVLYMSVRLFGSVSFLLSLAHFSALRFLSVALSLFCIVFRDPGPLPLRSRVGKSN